MQLGNPVTPVDEADVLVAAGLSEVRNQSSLTDYTGQLKANTTVRITDADNGGSSGSDPVTVSDGGSDGLVSSGPNTLLARQGIFVP